MRRFVSLIAALALLLTACGGGEVGNAGPVGTQSPTTTEPLTSASSTTLPPAADQIFVELFFVKEGISARPVLRAVDTPEVAANAIRALIAGPTPDEADTELSSSIPPDTLLLGLNIADGTATIDLSREFESGGGSFNILSRLAQVVYTLTQFETVDDVVFHLDGERVTVFSGEGVLLEDPVERSDYESILPIDPGTNAGTARAWMQSDLPDVSGLDPTNRFRVALVASDDVLNVREDPGVSAPIVGMLMPGVVVGTTGLQQIVGSSLWVQIGTPNGGFWVNSRFLAPVIDPAEFAGDERVGELLEEFKTRILNDDDLRPVISRRGLFVSHHSDPVRWPLDELDTILTDTTTYQWPSNAIDEDDPEFDLLPPRTFAAGVADSFVSAFDDSDTITTVNEPIEAGNSRLPEYAIPFEFQSFNYIGVHDPGDDPQYDGLDWVTWYVSIDYEDDRPIIVGLTLDMWSP